MKALLITAKGGEETAKQEIKELINADSTITEEAVEFEFSDYKDIFILAYCSQSASRIILLDKIENWLKEGMTFRVTCEEREKEEGIGAEINKKNIYKVDLEKPQITLFQHKEKLGIDFTGDISKRNFRIFTHRHSMKGTTAFILLKEAGFTGKETLLDPFCKDGTLTLEAVHYSIRRPIRFYEKENFPFLKMEKFKSFNFEKFFESFKEKESKATIYAVSSDSRDLEATKKNAKIAGVKDFSVSRLDLDWLDTKFEKNEIDLLVTHLPKLTPKQLKELYYQAVFIAKKIVLLVEADFKHEDENLKIEKEKVIHTGKAEKKILFMRKEKYN